MKVEINQFWIESKRSKKQIIVWAIITFLITSLIGHFFIEPSFSFLEEKFSSKPEIISNIVLYENINISDTNTHMEDFFFLYTLGEDWSTIMFVNGSDKRKIKEYNNMICPTFQICSGCSIYSFNIKNIGDKKADKIYIDIKSSSFPELILDSPKMTKKECGGYFDTMGCYIIIENIEIGEKINFLIKFNESQDLIVPSCITNEKYLCKIQFLKIKAQTINPLIDIIKMNNQIISFPTLATFKPNTLYYFDPKKSNATNSVWVNIPSNYWSDKNLLT